MKIQEEKTHYFFHAFSDTLGISTAQIPHIERKQRLVEDVHRLHWLIHVLQPQDSYLQSKSNPASQSAMKIHGFRAGTLMCYPTLSSRKRLALSSNM